MFSNISPQPSLARRSFLSRLGAGMTVLGATLAGGSGTLQAQSTGNGRWQPSRHPQDDWLDQVPGMHRFVFDTISPAGIGTALLYANNFFLASQSDYGLANADAAVVIVMRHNSTPFAFNDAMWAKYGAPLTERGRFVDPRTKQTPTINVYNSAAQGGLLTNLGTTLDSLAKRGVQFAVCQMATRRLAGMIAGTGGNAENVYKEIVANLVSNSHMVPAGIVAVNRAQERGYAFASVG